jgi:hypothetical protein
MKDSIVNIQAIHHLFFRMLPDNRMEDWSPATFENYEAIDIGNRYFTDRRDILTSEAISFKTSVDPDGILEAVTSGDEFAHTHENEVEYFEMMMDQNGQNRQVDWQQITLED